MGMAASQSRLLSLTSRLSDLELQAQTISNAKIRLSMKSSASQKAYLDALDKQVLTVNSGSTTNKATVANLTTYNPNNFSKQRFIKNSANQILVSQDIYNAYNASSHDLNKFLSATIGIADTADSNSDKIKSGVAYKGTKDYSATDAISRELVNNLTNLKSNMTDMASKYNTKASTLTEDDEASEKAEYEASAQKATDIATMLGEIITSVQTNGVNDATRNALKAVLTGDSDAVTAAATEGVITSTTLLDASANNNVDSFFEDMDAIGDESHTNDASEVKFYTNLFNEIEESGCNAPGDTNLNSSDWLTGQVDAHNIFLYEYDSDGGADGTGDFVETSWSSGDTTIGTKSDDQAIAIAEAQYEAEMQQTQAKDKRYDMELQNINTEHTATQTEIDSVKKVIDKNIERAFKIFDA